MNTTRRLNLAILSSATVNARISGLVARTFPPAAEFTVDEPGRTPHLTLFMSRFPGDAVDAVLTEVAAFAERTPRFEMRAVSISLTRGGFVEIGFLQSALLRQVQNSAIETLAPLRDPISARAGDHGDTDATTASNLAEFGYDLVKDNFRPHLTIGKVAPGTSIQLASEFDPETFTFIAERIVLGETDNWGSIRSILSVLELGQRDS